MLFFRGFFFSAINMFTNLPFLGCLPWSFSLVPGADSVVQADQPVARYTNAIRAASTTCLLAASIAYQKFTAGNTSQFCSFHFEILQIYLIHMVIYEMSCALLRAAPAQKFCSARDTLSAQRDTFSHP